MILLVLPLLFSQLIGLFANWLPTLYLLLWPVLIQTDVTRDNLIIHALVLIIFILTCDVIRQTMHKLIGFDLISFPVSLLLLMSLVTERGTMFLTFLKPLFGALITMVEPLFLALEVYLAVDLIRRFNKWISHLANTHDENSQDLSSWEPPLSSGAILTRCFVIIIAVCSYIATFIIVQESKALLGTEEDVPINFSHATAALVTLQVIAFASIIYKEEGILSESALICLLAAVPIFIAAWSYNHLKESKSATSSLWSYWPFSSFLSSDDASSSSSRSSYYYEQLVAEEPHLGSSYSHFGTNFEPAGFYQDETRRSRRATQNFDMTKLDSSIQSLLSAWLANVFTKDLLLFVSRRLIMIINSLLGLSLSKLVNSYLGADLCLILVARLFALLLLAALLTRNDEQPRSSNQREAYGFVLLERDEPAERERRSSGGAWRLIKRHLPLNKWSLIKVLLVLAYTQMLIQQLENRNHFQEQIALLTDASKQHSVEPACCGARHAQLERPPEEGEEEAGRVDVGAWLNCMWTSARACSGGGGGAAGSQAGLESRSPPSRAARFLAAIRDWLGKALSGLLNLWLWLYVRLSQLDSFFHSLSAHWFARWRSPIVQRLGQSVLVHLYYIAVVAFAYE